MQNDSVAVMTYETLNEAKNSLLFHLYGSLTWHASRKVE